MTNCHRRPLKTKDQFLSIHCKNLAIEMFKVQNNLAAKIINDLFYNETENYHYLRHCRDFNVSSINLIYHGNESTSYLDPKMLHIAQPEIKEINSLNSFKKSMRKWIPVDCLCWLCKTYISRVGLIWNFKVLWTAYWEIKFVCLKDDFGISISIVLFIKHLVFT